MMAYYILIFWNILALIAFLGVLVVTLKEKEWNPIKIGPIRMPKIVWVIFIIWLLICTLIVFIWKA